ncbi:hypothetical protein L7F22_013044 [Adiantum nelumboides]|nr:hypothetical protein [Adiantum nelumboides]
METPLPTHGGESSVHYQVCEGTRELMQELEINQSLTIGLFDNVVNLIQKKEFVRKQEVTTHSLCIVVYAKHTEGSEMVTDVALRSHVKPPESSAELKEFHQVYGDSYIVSRSTISASTPSTVRRWRSNNKCQ